MKVIKPDEAGVAAMVAEANEPETGNYGVLQERAMTLWMKGLGITRVKCDSYGMILKKGLRTSWLEFFDKYLTVLGKTSGSYEFVVKDDGVVEWKDFGAADSMCPEQKKVSSFQGEIP